MRKRRDVKPPIDPHAPLITPPPATDPSDTDKAPTMLFFTGTQFDELCRNIELDAVARIERALRLLKECEPPQGRAAVERALACIDVQRHHIANGQ